MSVGVPVAINSSDRSLSVTPDGTRVYLLRFISRIPGSGDLKQ
jgi:hypothetical protein